MRRYTALLIGALACSSTETGEDTNPCLEVAPVCLQACGSDVQFAAQCGDDGIWTCGAGVADDTCTVACEGPPLACLDDCAGDVSHDAACEDGVWTCGDGVPTDECGRCSGAPVPCLDECGSEVEVGETICEDGTWICPEGFPSTACDPCDGEEPLECIESCDEGEIYEATCVADVWDCGDGELVDACDDEPSSCAPGNECECSGDPYQCVPSCEVFEIYDASCSEAAWSCGDGVLAADC